MAFELLTEKIQLIFKKLKGQSRLTETNMAQILDEIKVALLEADVNLKVVRYFLEQIKLQAIGEKVYGDLNPSQTVIKIVREQLIALLGNQEEPLIKAKQGPNVMMMVGLQGTGKTSTAAKIAYHLQTKEKQKVLLVAADIYRPAAIEQLETLAQQVNCHFYKEPNEKKVSNIVSNAYQYSLDNHINTLIIDTAGRLHIDEALMEELKSIEEKVALSDTLLVVDAMSGQDAYNVAKSFHQQLHISGLVMSKLDGDARGGAALSIRHLTGLPIKFISVGEKVTDLELFYPDRMADRILGMGDVVTLIEKAQEKIDEKEAKKSIDKMMSGRFDLEDMMSQLRQVQKLGSLGGILKMLPGVPKISQEQQQQAEREMKNFEVIINSMTKEERSNPDIIRNSRKLRIAKGSGKTSADVNRVLKKYEQTRDLMRMMKSKGTSGFPFK